jgi:hypothetical protein
LAGHPAWFAVVGTCSDVHIQLEALRFHAQMTCSTGCTILKTDASSTGCRCRQAELLKLEHEVTDTQSSAV